ncbi:U1 small nuclear ribonucleoprotein C-like [Watersipora subatra]|uniref:U1 small nuclear ribonucleoprotein C-like n=1 Tax=Watersipora subatra TaxID=2589382 RepID=UPI00355C493F
MPKYYCDYCDTYLTHDSPSVRKTHCSGRKHKENVRIYYQKWLEEQVQKLVDDTTAAYQQGKLPNNPFQGQAPATGAIPGNAMVPPPASLGAAPGAPHLAGPMMGMAGPPARPMMPNMQMGPGIARPMMGAPGPMMR